MSTGTELGGLYVQASARQVLRHVTVAGGVIPDTRNAVTVLAGSLGLSYAGGSNFGNRGRYSSSLWFLARGRRISRNVSNSFGVSGCFPPK